MNRISTLIFHNLKKSKGQYTSFGVIICLTSFILNIALVLAFQTFDAYDRRFEELNTADINLIIPEMQDYDGLIDELEEISGVSEAERHEGVFAPVTVRKFAGSDFDMNTVFYNIDAERDINRLEISDRNEEKENTIYVPAYMTELGGFSVGDEIVYSVGGSECSYMIGGTVGEMQYGNYGTGLIGGYFPAGLFEAFKEEHAENAAVEYSFKLDDGAEIGSVKADIAGFAKNKGLASLSINDRESSRQARTMVSTLLIVIFIALAVIILAVSIFLSDFRIRSSIEDEMIQMGVLKALGYTSLMIINSSVIPYVLTGEAAALLGTGLSYAAIPFAAHILAVQSGFSFTPAFDLGAFLISVIIPAACILVFSYIAARRIRRLQPINAIRRIEESGKGKNRFPLESSKAGVGLTLVLKQTFASAGRNILLFAVSFGIMILLSFSGTLLYNVAVKPDNFMNTLQEESPSVIFTSGEGGLDELKSILENDGRVQLVLEYASSSVSYGDGSLTAFVCEDFSLVTNDICYEGRNPENASEIAVGSAIAEDYPIGSEIEIGNGVKYTVTGYVQSVNNGGEVCELTSEGYYAIGGELNTLYTYIEGSSAEELIKEYEHKHGELIVSSVNYERLAENGRKMYIGIVAAVAVVLFVISALMVLLVMYIIINSMISRRRQEFGIYKAIGYTSRQLAVQTALSFVPVIGISAVLSAAAGLWYMPVINNKIFGLIGAVKNHFEVTFAVLLAFAAALTVCAFLISLVLAAPIKKITAYSLLKE